MVRATETLERQLRLYEAESDRFRQSDDAVRRAEAEGLVAYANFLYDRIKHIDEALSAAVPRAGGTPSEADAEAVWNLYMIWWGRAEADLRRATELEAKGEKISGLHRLRQAWYEARDVLAIPPDHVRRSARSAREGRTRSLGEIRDELQRSPH